MVAAIAHGHWQTMTCIAGLRCDGLTAPGVIEGAMDGDAFAQDSKTQRAATLQKGAVVGLDKLPAHQRDGARRAVEKRGAWLLFLPPYAPDCNPIARALAKFKAHMKRLKPRPIDDLWQAAGTVCGRFNHAHCRTLFVADGYLCRGLIEHLDRKRFSITLLRSPIIPVDDPMTRAIAVLADEVIDLPDNLAAARILVVETEADLIYFPEIGMEDLVYFLAFARSAPVPMVGWGHPVTTGIPNVDVFLSVTDMEPEGTSTHYSERLIALDGLSLCVSPPLMDKTIPDRESFGLDPDWPAYLCAQSLYKIHFEFDPVVAAILDKDKGARAYFISIRNQSDDIFLSRLERVVGSNMDRVHLMPRIPSKEFLLLLKSADVLLDVPHWSGGKTSLESLAAGTPIVHWPGRFMRGRHTLAFYKRMGVMDCVVHNAEDYVDAAVRLVHDRPFRTSVRAKIADTAVVLFNDTSAIDEVSDVLKRLFGSRAKGFRNRCFPTAQIATPII